MLEFGSALPIGERHGGLDAPRPQLGRVRDATGIVIAKPTLQVVGQPDVVCVGPDIGNEHVNIAEARGMGTYAMLSPMGLAKS